MFIKSLTIGMYFIIVFILNASCGGSGETIEEDPYLVNTNKLIATPFENLTTGDSIDPLTLLCGKYRTEAINSFPIPVFAALFTAIQEEVIQEAINIANDSIGFTAYKYTDTWTDDVRVIYKVENLSDIGSPIGHAKVLAQTLNNKQYSERLITDWAIRITFVEDFIIAHELGHAAGIPGHILINYENDTTTDLESKSIMEADAGWGLNVMNDYNFMMSMQGQIMQEHLGETGEIVKGFCD